MARQRAGSPTPHAVDNGTATLIPDPHRPRAFTLSVEGTPQSYVDLDDPTVLEFEYVQRMAIALDLVTNPREPLRVLHLGGGGLTLPRYLAVTRPGSQHRVVEADAALAHVVRRVLPWPREQRFRVRVDDARTALQSARGHFYDVVISDVFVGARTPRHLMSREFLTEVARVLRPGGHYLVNISDGSPLTFARAQAATLREVFAEVCLVADSAVLRRRRFGNLVGLASDGPLPISALSRRAAGAAFPARVLAGGELTRFIAGTRPMTDETATDSPAPPDGVFAS